MPPKRRRRFQGLYYHSSPPKVLPMNGHLHTESNRKRRETDDLSVKLSTIRIWMHEKDIGKLTRILWAGQGNRLRQQASTNPKVKRFLAAVPYVMNSIRGVHQAVIENSLETLQANLEPPVPPSLVTCRDANGLNLIHKAAGLGHATILEYLIATWPDGVHEWDITGKTPLHWAASAKNNMRCYTLLTRAGCDEEAVDYKMKTPSYYRHKPHDIERAFLLYVPEAPRVSPDIATDWVALSDDSGDGKKLDIKIPELNGFGRHSNTESNENTSEAEMTEGASTADDEDAGVAETEIEPEQEPETEHELEAEPSNDIDLDEKDENAAESGHEEEPQPNDDNAKENDADDTEEANEEAQPAHEEEAEPQDEKLTQSTNESIPETKDDKEDHVDHTSPVESDDIAESSEEANENAAKTNDRSSVKESEEVAEIVKYGNEKIKEDEEEEDQTSALEAENNEKEEIKESVESAAEKSENNENTQDLHHKNSIENETDKEHEQENSHDLSEESTGKRHLEKDEANVANEQAKEENHESEETEDNKEEPDNKISETEIEKEKDLKEVDENKVTSAERHVDNATSPQSAEKKSNGGGDNEGNAIESDEQSTEKGKNVAAYGDMNNKLDESDEQHIKKDEKKAEGEAEIEPDSVAEGKDIINPETEKTLKGKVPLKSLDNICDENENQEKRILDNNNDPVTNISASYKDELTPTNDKKIFIADSKDVEDENNNNNKALTKSIVDGEVHDVVETAIHKLSENAEEARESSESFLQEVHQDISDKLAEISENFKDNFKNLNDKIQNVFSSSDEKVENEENDNNSNKANGSDIDEVVVGKSASPAMAVKTPLTKGNKAKRNHGGSGDNSNNESNEDYEDDEESVITAVTNDNRNVSGDSNKDADMQSSPEENNVAVNNASPSESSHTSPLAIEGFVHGDAEDNTVQSQTAVYNDNDDNEETRLKRAISSGDMEQLAQIVLNGDGHKLLDVEATEPEIQAFLRNVPNYMDKIRRVHEASRSGSLLNLQQALDRRKFAVAKDEISPNGASPLHVAVLFGHSDIVRYLAARFPETTSVTDNDGRTALHYAAVINDNGHFYNVLQQLGANPKALDLMGKTPEQYGPNDTPKDNFNYRQLLKSFGAEDLDKKLLNDQGQVENHSYEENPLFKTEQGKYLADNLADPLIKALTQVAHKRPQDPLQYLTNYLQNFASTRNTNGKTVVQAAVHSASSHTNSTALANSNSTPPPAPIGARQFQPTSQMNGHVKYDNADDIEGEVLQLHDDDEGNDSDAALSKKLQDRDEHGQSMLHFACARTHRRGGLLHLIEESKADITYRDELYRTARDVALQANQVGNAKEIDRYLISLAVVGDVKPFEYVALAGYDHIIDVMDENEVTIIDLVEAKGHTELASYLKTVRPMEELREELHQMIRDLKVERVKEILDGENGKTLIVAKNYYGRAALHIAILKESEEIIEHIVKMCPEALKIGDNLERSPLHYAMGTNLVEGISRILIQNGAKRTSKDLKGRQPSYYFMNKADILRLQEEEDESR